MRYLHPVQAHERFVASGTYRFIKDGRVLEKSEAWTLHEHANGERFIRVDVDARREQGKSILVEALQTSDGDLARLDINYENERFESGIKQLRATYQLEAGRLQVGFNMNGADRQYQEIDLPQGTLFDIPLLIFRGMTVVELSQNTEDSRPIYVPMFEHAQLFPGTLQTVSNMVDYSGHDMVVMGKREFSARRYRYRDRAAVYWIDEHGVVVKRVNAFKQQEIVVQIRDYAAPKQRNLGAASERL